ncbi:hypothetical protein HOG75_00620 [bacterium]|nr:hypothetical protein [bacterium]MBT3581744.1 hypothetical protein [bacterium]MBT5988199.1 hypothetical protein [bacterium]
MNELKVNIDRFLDYTKQFFWRFSFFFLILIFLLLSLGSVFFVLNIQKTENMQEELLLAKQTRFDFLLSVYSDLRFFPFLRNLNVELERFLLFKEKNVYQEDSLELALDKIEIFLHYLEALTIKKFDHKDVKIIVDNLGTEDMLWFKKELNRNYRYKKSKEALKYILAEQQIYNDFNEKSQGYFIWQMQRLTNNLLALKAETNSPKINLKLTKILGQGHDPRFLINYNKVLLKVDADYWQKLDGFSKYFYFYYLRKVKESL